MEKIDMMSAHKWEPNEKGRNRSDGGSTGKTIKASRMARICWCISSSEGLGGQRTDHGRCGLL